MAADRNASPPEKLGWFPIAMTVLIGATRLLPYVLPYPWNFAPVGAMSLYGGARLRFWQALTLPLLVMTVTDVIIWRWKGAAYGPFDPWVYGSFAVSVLLGRLLVGTNSPWRIGSVAVLYSVLFFLVTNFGAWLGMRVDPNTIPSNAAMMRVPNSDYPNGELKYANNLNGLLQCYVMGAKFSPENKGAEYGFALPPLVSNLLFTGLLFGLHAGAFGIERRRVPATARTAVGGAL